MPERNILDLELAEPRNRALFASYSRDLTEADVKLTELNLGTKAPPRKRLTDRHHALARALSSGMTPGQASVLVGLAPSTVSILQADPSFQELLTFYRQNVDAAYVQMHETLSGLSLDALLELRERLEEDPEGISNTMLLEIAKMGADRTGHGPQAKTEVNVNVSLATRLEEARKRVAQRVIDVTPLKGTDDAA